MRIKKHVAAGAVALSALTAAILPASSAQAADNTSWCGADWLSITSYSGPASGSFNHMSSRTCVGKTIINGAEYFSGTAAVRNGATINGHYNGNYGSRWVQFGSANANAMSGNNLGFNNALKVMKGKYGHPSNNCYAGELMPGYTIACTSDWVLDNTPQSATTITGYAQVGAYFWQAGMNRWEWATGSAVRGSSVLN
ncbi:hypothetical protein ACIOMM_36645 [Streptomyces sp. NPDC087908]|uniref:hypothetical protein n=1 Tax=Streptomyces sp. NPDC087908 TaxID=3365820 RepID=UPI0038224753